MTLRYILPLKYTKMINFDQITSENQTDHNPNWRHIPDYLHGILIIGGS